MKAPRPRDDASAVVTELARGVADLVLKHVPLQAFSGSVPIPLERVAREFGVTFRNKSDDISESIGDLRALGLEGTAQSDSVRGIEAASAAGWLHSDYEIQVLSRGFRARFTAAHELSHVVLASELMGGDADLSITERERVCDLAAGEILLPLQALGGFFKSRGDLTLSLAELERLSARMRVSLSLTINRLQQLSRQDRLELANVCLLARLGRSRKQHENLAPRVTAACGPKRYFLPVNARLSSIGFNQLEVAFYSVPCYVLFRRREELLVWDYQVRKRGVVPCSLQFKCYQWAQTGQVTMEDENRLMLVVASIEAVNDKSERSRE